MAAIRYFVNDVDRAIAFYTEHLSFKLEKQMGAAIASVSRNDLILWLSGPESSAARPMPDGRRPEPGGWNRLLVEVKDLRSRVAELNRLVSVSAVKSSRALAVIKSWWKTRMAIQSSYSSLLRAAQQGAPADRQTAARFAVG